MENYKLKLLLIIVPIIFLSTAYFLSIHQSLNYFDKAIENKDYKLCKIIENNNIRNECYYNLSALLKNHTLCKEISGDSRLSFDCFLNVLGSNPPSPWIRVIIVTTLISLFYLIMFIPYKLLARKIKHLHIIILGILFIPLIVVFINKFFIKSPAISQFIGIIISYIEKMLVELQIIILFSIVSGFIINKIYRKMFSRKAEHQV